VISGQARYVATDRWLDLAGVVGGSIWIGLRFFSPEWGPPGTAAYAGYELWNHVWAPALVLMAAGFLGGRRSDALAHRRAARAGLSILITGLVVMAIGNIAEFWVFTDVPYNGGGGPNARDLSWMSFLVGALLAAVGATAAGLAMVAQRTAPIWVSAPLALVLPATFLLGSIDMSWAGAPIGIAAVAYGTYGIHLRARQLSTS